VASASPDDIQRTLGMTPAGRWRRLGRWFIAIIGWSATELLAESVKTGP
jgi:hypothetical protein